MVIDFMIHVLVSIAHGVLLKRNRWVFFRRRSRFYVQLSQPQMMVDQHDDSGSGVLWSCQPRSSPTVHDVWGRCLGNVGIGVDFDDECPPLWRLRETALGYS